MAKVSKFEDLEVWKESMRLAVSIYELIQDSRNYALKDQMLRSSISVPSNIAEGFERDSNKEYIRFLVIAKGSIAELRTQLYLLKEISDKDKKQAINEFITKTKHISAMLQRFVSARRNFE